MDFNELFKEVEAVDTMVKNGRLQDAAKALRRTLEKHWLHPVTFLLLPNLVLAEKRMASGDLEGAAALLGCMADDSRRFRQIFVNEPVPPMEPGTMAFAA